MAEDHGKDDAQAPFDATLTAAPNSNKTALAETLASDSAMADTLGPTQSPTQTYAAGSLVGRYIVEGELGRGAMGVVLRARNPELSRRVAIKLLQPRDGGLSDDARQRLIREAQAIAQLSDPNVVQVYDVGMHGDAVFIAMELVEGKTLREWLGDENDRDEILEVLRQAGSGLLAAHALGIVHRDFKPDNVLVGNDGRVRVLDFGLARSVSSPAESLAETAVSVPELTATVTVAGTMMGTPAYMAPEQWKGEKADQRADQFAYCCVIHEALCGHRPFDGATVDELRDNVIAGVRAKAVDGIPKYLRPIIDDGLSVNPEHRFGTISEIVASLAPPRKRWPIAAAGAVGLGAIATATTLLLSAGDEPTPPPPEPTLRPVVKQVVREAGIHLHPSLSTDGSQLVYSDQTDVFLRVMSDGTAPDPVRNLTADFAPAATEPRLSPDGESVVFSADAVLYVMPSSGGSPRTLVERGFWPTWSPDGKYVAYVTEDRYDPMVSVDSREPELWTVNVASGKRTRVIDTELTASQPHWSPDGARIVFASGNHFMTARPDGSDVRGTGIRTSWSPVWNATSDGLYAITENGGRYDIVLFELDPATWAADVTRMRSIVTVSEDTPWQLDVSRDGRRFVAAVHSSSLRTFKIDFDPDAGKVVSVPTPFTDPILSLISPAVSADGKTLVFTSFTEVDEDLYIINIDGSGGRRLLRGGEYRRSPVFSPTDGRIAYQGTIDGTWGIHRVNQDGSGVETLSVNPTLKFPHWAPDGKRIAVTASPDSSVNFPYIVEAEKPWTPQGEAQHNPELAGWRTGPWSPDGSKVAVFSAKGLGLLDSETRQLTVIAPHGDDAAWLADSRRLLVVDRKRVVLIDTVSRQEHEVVSLAPSRATSLPSIALTPDNRTIFISTNYEQASIWRADLVSR